MGTPFDDSNSKTLNPHQIDGSGSHWSVRVTEGPQIHTGRGSHAAGVVDGMVVVTGGTAWNADRTVKSFLTNTEVFGKDGWTEGPDLPIGLAEGAFAQDDTGLYLAGGLSGVDQPTTVACCITAHHGKLQVQRLPDLPESIRGCGGAIIDGKFFVVCGQLGGRMAANHVWSLDLSSKDSKWIEMASLPGTGRAYPGVVACADSLYVLGGLADGTQSVHDRTLGDAFRYDPKSNRWFALGSLPMAGYCWNAAPVDARHVVLAGCADGQAHNEIWLLDINTLGASIVGRVVIQVACAPLIKVSENTWWLIGGEPDSQKNRTNRVSEISLR
ncbi:MAG TPA: kelch repeat-containing protein [Tepidisphaeraceae bacterium]|jgi:N-acetylneuraminic acid mutarotase|nr:kelch repeat-containing protein [Tepidisphaeraceae bacterium]